jgi:hypothetical protein
MMLRGTGLRPWISAELAESARDAVARSQSALADDHLDGALRHFLSLYDLLVPPLDARMRQLCEKRSFPSHDGDGEAPVIPLSAAVGLTGLWAELPDIDVEREAIEDLLVLFAGRSDAPDDDAADLTKEKLEAVLRAAPRPRAELWRRFMRLCSGPLGDLCHVTVQRGDKIVLERPPAGRFHAASASADGDPAAPVQGDGFSTQLGDFFGGDRLTLRLAAPRPGKVAILHFQEAVDGDDVAPLTLLLPQDPGEAASRRMGELVEIVGELSTPKGHPAPPARDDGKHGPEAHSLIVLFGPELLPPSWAEEVVARRRVPKETRLWRYAYKVAPAS